MVPARVLVTVSCTTPTSTAFTITATGFSLLNQTTSAVITAAMVISVIKILKRFTGMSLSRVILHLTDAVVLKQKLYVDLVVSL